MGSAMTIGMLMGGLGAASTVAGSIGQNQQARAQARSLEAQARSARIQGEAEAAKIDRQKIQMRRQYEDTQGRNRSLLAAGNVDMSSGSAARTEAGNISRFAADIGDNAYARAMKLWETKASEETMKAQASNVRKSAPGVLGTLLNAAISGAGGFASGYSMAGGSLRGLFGGETETARQAGKSLLPPGAVTVKKKPV